MLLAGPGWAVAQTVPDEQVVPGQIIVKYKDDIGSSEQASVRGEEGLDKKAELDLINAEVVEVEGQPAQESINDLNARSEIEYAEPDMTVYAADYAEWVLWHSLCRGGILYKLLYITRCLDPADLCGNNSGHLPSPRTPYGTTTSVPPRESLPYWTEALPPQTPPRPSRSTLVSLTFRPQATSGPQA
jgi:hypothetical protein